MHGGIPKILTNCGLGISQNSSCGLSTIRWAGAAAVRAKEAARAKAAANEAARPEVGTAARALARVATALVRVVRATVKPARSAGRAVAAGAGWAAGAARARRVRARARAARARARAKATQKKQQEHQDQQEEQAAAKTAKPFCCSKSSGSSCKSTSLESQTQGTIPTPDRNTVLLKDNSDSASATRATSESVLSLEKININCWWHVLHKFIYTMGWRRQRTAMKTCEKATKHWGGKYVCQYMSWPLNGKPVVTWKVLWT